MKIQEYISNRKRTAKYRARMAEKGYRMLQIWVHKTDREKVRRFALKLRKDRQARSPVGRPSKYV